MIEWLKQTGKRYYFSREGERKFVFLLFPYLPFRGDVGGARVDGYYPASNEGYRFCKGLSQKLSAQGVCHVFSPVINFKGMLSRASEDFFVGKNTLLYHREYGSRFCIEAFELFEEVPAAWVEPGRCIGCGKCAEACPTGAIGDGTFDRSKCLRQIMNRTDFSDETAEKIGCRLFGCDVCQRVCPHNAGIAEREDPLADFLKYETLLEAAQSKRTLEPLLPSVGSNYLRPRRILNLAVVGAGNSGDTALIPKLLPLLERDDADLRRNAARAIERLRSVRP